MFQVECSWPDRGQYYDRSGLENFPVIDRSDGELLPRSEVTVLATEVHERISIDPLCIHHFSEQDGMVACFDHLTDTALHGSEAAIQQRNTSAAPMPGKPGEPVAFANGKPDG